MPPLTDQPNCYLVQGGWAYRFAVSGRHSAVRSIPVPLAYAEQSGLYADGSAEFRTPDDEPVTIERQNHRARLVGLDTVSELVQAQIHDAVFIVLKSESARFELRSWKNRPQVDPLARLLWHCGLDPEHAIQPSVAWKELGIALGGPATDFENVVGRLEIRRQFDLVSWAKEAQKPWARHLHDPWPEEWEFQLPALAEYPKMLVLQGRDRSLRVAAGVSHMVEKRPAEWIRTPNGVVWRTFDDGAAIRRAEIDQGWARWVRAEHVSRHAALAGHDWRVSKNGEGWRAGDGQLRPLREALELSEYDREIHGLVRPPILNDCPSTEAAWEQLVDHAESEGIYELGANRHLGFEARYGNGTIAVGATLADVLQGGVPKAERRSSLRLESSIPSYLRPGAIVTHKHAGLCTVEAFELETVEAMRREYVVLMGVAVDVRLKSPIPDCLDQIRPVMDSSTRQQVENILAAQPATLDRRKLSMAAYQRIDWAEPLLLASELRDLAHMRRQGDLPVQNKARLRRIFNALAAEFAASSGEDLRSIERDLFDRLHMDGGFRINPAKIEAVANKPKSPKARYIAGPITPIDDLETLDKSNIHEALLAIIDVEGPVTADRLFDLVVRRAANRRITRSIRKVMNRTLRSLKGVLISEYRNPLTNWPQRVVRLIDTPTVVIRERGPRNLHEIPMDEVSAVWDLLGLKPDEAGLCAILEFYDLTRLTDRARSFITAAISSRPPDAPRS